MFEHITSNIAAEEDEITTPGCLSLENLEQAEIEVERLLLLKTSKMKELVLKKRMELEEACRNAHLEPDPNTAEEKLHLRRGCRLPFNRLRSNIPVSFIWKRCVRW